MNKTPALGAAVIDPPWPGQGAPYDTLPLRRILEFNIRPLMADNSHIYIWVPANKLIRTAIELAERNGAVVRNVLTWVKSRPGRPTRYLQANTELLLFCTIGDAPVKVRGQQTLMYAATQLSGQKPAQTYGLVETLSEGPYGEFFARTNQPGWESWGGELETSSITIGGWPVSSDFQKEAA